MPTAAPGGVRRFLSSAAGRFRPAPYNRRVASKVAAGNRSLARALFGGGPRGNERLTLVAGYLLLALLVAIGVTILRLRQLLEVHIVVGLLALGPLGLKLAAVGWRFVRYYARSRSYREKGPPPFYLRALGPLFTALTLAVFASGLVLLVDGPAARQPWLFLHKASFVLWLAAFAVHLFGHARQLAGGAGYNLRLRGELAQLLPELEPPSAAGRLGRAVALVLAVGAGAVAAATLASRYTYKLPPRDSATAQRAKAIL